MSTIDEFHAIEMKIGTILSAEYIEGADKLLKLSVDFGPKQLPHEGDASVTPSSEESSTENDVRQILSGIREYYEPSDLVGKQCPFVTNLPARTLRGLTSHGMILAVGLATGTAVLLHPDKPVQNGSALR
jgi:methionyl-tRNA synthetase